MTQNKLSFAIVFSIISASIISSQAMDQPVPPKINPSPFQGGLFDTIPPELIKEIQKYKQEISLYTDEEIIELTKSNYFSVPPLINERFKKIESVDIISMFPETITDDDILRIQNEYCNFLEDNHNYFKENEGVKYFINTDNFSLLYDLLRKLKNSPPSKYKQRALSQKNQEQAVLVPSSVVSMQQSIGQGIPKTIYLAKYEYRADNYSNPYIIYLAINGKIVSKY